MMQDVHVKLYPGFHGKISIQQEECSFHQKIGFRGTFKEETSEMLHLKHGFVWCCTCTLRKVDQKYLESFEMWCWRMKEISSTVCVEKEEALKRIKKERNILHTMKRRKAKWMGHILRRTCRLKHATEGKEKWGRQCKQLLDDLREKRRYCNFNKNALSHSV
jgi:hypothetical protein